MTLARCIDANSLPLVVGKRYDVAWIYEWPDLGMVRKDDGDWPTPGDDAVFGWHLESLFEFPQGGIEVRPCGYHLYNEEFYGFVIRRSDRVRLSKRLQEAALREMVRRHGGVLLPWIEETSRYHGLIPNDATHFVGFDFWRLGRLHSFAKARRLIDEMLVLHDLDPKRFPKPSHEEVAYWTKTDLVFDFVRHRRTASASAKSTRRKRRR